MARCAAHGKNEDTCMDCHPDRPSTVRALQVQEYGFPADYASRSTRQQFAQEVFGPFRGDAVFGKGADARASMGWVSQSVEILRDNQPEVPILSSRGAGAGYWESTDDREIFRYEVAPTLNSAQTQVERVRDNLHNSMEGQHPAMAAYLDSVLTAAYTAIGSTRDVLASSFEIQEEVTHHE